MAYQDLERRLKFLRASLRRHGTSHVVEVFRQALARRRYAARPIPPLSPQAMISLLGGTDAASALERFDAGLSRRATLSRRNRKEFYTALLSTVDTYDAIVDDAELIASGRFPALGICVGEPDGTFDWHRDYSSNERWPDAPFNRIDFMRGEGSDVKYVWELSRMYWVSWLGRAYWATGNGAWANDFRRLVGDWIEKNPVDVGVNWSMPMEIAIRGYWLTIGFGYFHGAPNIESEWWIEYLRCVWAHGTHLERNLEYFSNLTNHYISNCFGLVALGAFFADTTDGARWLADGRRRLLAELDHQVLSDGVHYERSICYHRLVTEFFLVGAILCERAAAPFPMDARAAVERMCEFILDYSPPVGTVPQLGDSDDGVLLRTSPRQELYDHRDTLSIAAVFFGRADFATAAGSFPQSALMLLGAEGYERFRGLRGSSGRGSRIYRDGGFAILRSDAMHVLADVGEIGLHGNNDTLAFTLSTLAGEIVVDPGTYCYTRDRETRNELRSTGAHDGPSIDGVEIAEFDGLWRIRQDRTEPRIIDWRTEANGATVLEASHRAYESIGVLLRRRWELTAGELRVTDTMAGTGEHRVEVRFTLHPECRATKVDATSVTIARGDSTLLLTCSLPIDAVDGWYSPSYGVARQTTVLTLRTGLSAGSEISYIWRSIS